MEATNTASILEFLSLTDNRKITQENILAWHQLIGHLNFDVAREAAHLAKQDDKIDWVEPKHILAKARVVADRLDAENRTKRALTPTEPFKGSPIPLCKHGERIVFCQPCCVELAKKKR